MDSHDTSRVAYVVGIRPGEQLSFLIPKEVAKAKNVNPGAQMQFRILRYSRKRWVEAGVMNARIQKQYKTLFAYIPKKLEKEQALEAQQEIGVEIIGRVI